MVSCVQKGYDVSGGEVVRDNKVAVVVEEGDLVRRKTRWGRVGERRSHLAAERMAWRV